jgi:hypothetical protein
LRLGSPSQKQLELESPMLTLNPFRASPGLLQKGAALLSLALVSLILASCTAKLVPPCPPVRIDNATAFVTKFKDGPGRDVTDIEYQAEILGFKGQCVYGTDRVDVVIDIDFALTSGAAVSSGTAPLYYFVAIPQFFPADTGKKVLQVNRKLPGKPAMRETFTESEVRVRIPLLKDQAGAAFDVYVGFQLDNAQLEYNRSRMQR